MSEKAGIQGFRAIDRTKRNALERVKSGRIDAFPIHRTTAECDRRRHRLPEFGVPWVTESVAAQT